jgi:hypothetical protein
MMEKDGPSNQREAKKGDESWRKANSKDAKSVQKESICNFKLGERSCENRVNYFFDPNANVEIGYAVAISGFLPKKVGPDRIAIFSAYDQFCERGVEEVNTCVQLYIPDGWIGHFFPIKTYISLREC